MLDGHSSGEAKLILRARIPRVEVEEIGHLVNEHLQKIIVSALEVLALGRADFSAARSGIHDSWRISQRQG